MRVARFECQQQHTCVLYAKNSAFGDPCKGTKKYLQVSSELNRLLQAVHVRYSLYISLPSSAKQQREMTNSALSEERELRRLIFKFYFKFIAVSQIQFRGSFGSDEQS